MYRIIMLAALMLSVMGGLWLLSGSAPLAAQGAAASATRSFSPATAVAPGATVTVTIEAVGYGSPRRSHGDAARWVRIRIQ